MWVFERFQMKLVYDAKTDAVIVRKHLHLLAARALRFPTYFSFFVDIYFLLASRIYFIFRQSV